MIDVLKQASRTEEKKQRVTDKEKSFSSVKAYKFSYLFSKENIGDEYLLDGTRYINIQLNYRKKWKEKYLSHLEDFSLCNNILPVITAIEEYPAVHKDLRIVQRLIDTDCIITANVQAVYKKRNRKLVYKLIERDMIDVLITGDAHDSQSFKSIKEAMEILCKQFSREKIEKLVNNYQELLDGADFERRRHKPFKKFLWFYY